MTDTEKLRKLEELLEAWGGIVIEKSGPKIRLSAPGAALRIYADTLDDVIESLPRTCFPRLDVRDVAPEVKP
jgi:hypothetical protein